MSVPNSPIQFWMHTNCPECAMGLVVTSKTCQFLCLSPRPLLCAHYIYVLSVYSVWFGPAGGHGDLVPNTHSRSPSYHTVPLVSPGCTYVCVCYCLQIEMYIHVYKINLWSILDNTNMVYARIVINKRFICLNQLLVFFHWWRYHLLFPKVDGHCYYRDTH